MALDTIDMTVESADQGDPIYGQGGLPGRDKPNHGHVVRASSAAAFINLACLAW
jgi:hypothetical protein